MGRRTVLSLILCVLTSTLSVSGSVSALSYVSGQSGQDVSWPNCDSLDLPTASFGIVGVNNGLSLSANRCIGIEASLYKHNLSLYVNSGFPGSPYDIKFASTPWTCSLSDTQCLAYNYGYNAGLYAVNYALSEGVVSTNWWIDVETDNSWTSNININRSSLLGELNGIETAAHTSAVGFYSYPTEWDILTGSWKVNAPIWQATDNSSSSLAQTTCQTASFNGQKPELTQYLNQKQTLDLDLAC